MDNTPRGRRHMGWPTALGIAGLFLSAAILYAGRQYALRDVCAANERFGAGAYTAVAVALASALLLAWSAVRRRNWLNIFTSSAVALACLGLAVIAFAANWAGVGGELAPDIRMRGNDGARFGFSEGFRISQIEVRGPQAMWRIRAIDQKRPPLIQEVGEIALGSVPEGYVEVEPLGVEAASLPDGDYKLTATALCAYRPAQAAFAIRQGRVVAE